MTIQSTEVDTPAPGRRVAWWVQALVYGGLAALLVLVAIQMRRNGPLAAGPVGAGQPAPDFTLTTFDGETVQLSALRGQVVVVNFWASWCPPCKDEAPALEAVWQRYREQGVVLVGVDYVDTQTDALIFIEAYGMTYLNGPDLGTRISQAYRVSGVPETYVVDRSGTLAHVELGPISEATLVAVIEPLLE